MNSRKALPFLLVGIFALRLTFAYALPTTPKYEREAGQDKLEPGTHPALKEDLVSDSGEKILEAAEASYQTTVAGLDSSSVLVRNLSRKNITAVGMIWTITFTGGKRYVIEQLVDYRLHRDIVSAKGVRPFAPYEEKFIPRLTKEPVEEGQVIESVKVEISFAEFEASGGVGVENSELYKQLLSQREGAEIYKRWLEDGYEDNPRSVANVVGKLSGDELPGGRELANDQARQGAMIYRQWMRDILRGKGEAALREQMRRQLPRQR